MILVTGATGMTGSELVRRLSAKGARVRGLTRNVAKAAALAALPNVEILEVDMDNLETLSSSLQLAEPAMLISSSDARMLPVQSHFIEAAHKARVTYIVKLSCP